MKRKNMTKRLNQRLRQSGHCLNLPKNFKNSDWVYYLDRWDKVTLINAGVDTVAIDDVTGFRNDGWSCQDPSSKYPQGTFVSS